MRSAKFIGILIVFGLLTTSVPLTNHPALADAQPEAVFTVGEGVDFATRQLSDPWDMKQFTDISQWLNHTSVPSYDLINIQVHSGVFSAQTQGIYSDFYPLFPGYSPGVNTGKIGALYPIASNTFHCFYMAMYATWPSTNTGYFHVTWAADRYLTHIGDETYDWGTAYGNQINKDHWKLYKIDLNTHPYINGDAWTSLSQWQMFRINPSNQEDTTFQVDWIRLTNCAPVNARLTGLPQNTYNLYLGWGSPERQILAESGITPAADGSYNWDVQGVEAGTFNYYVKKTDGTIVQQGSLVVDGTPIAAFVYPAPYTGVDYATSNGNTWSIDSSDVTEVACASHYYSNGMLILDTLPPSQLSDGCIGPGAGEADPIVRLNTPDHGNLSAYRYLSMNVYQNGALSYPDEGMIVRLIWQLDRPIGVDCYYISKAIPLDVVRQTYTIDLYNSWNGTPEARTPSDCPLVSWVNQASVGPLVNFRMDPNENIMDFTFHQEFDWIRLTQVEQVPAGQPVTLRLRLSEPASQLRPISFYYTTDLTAPTQHTALPYTPTLNLSPWAVFMPLAFNRTPDHDLDTPTADYVYHWNTAGAAPGTYYLCTIVSDAYTAASYCSQAPISIIAP